MKLIITILFFYCFTANATIYYVSNAGSDAANGTSTGTSWQSIAKVNAQTFSPDDQILFKAGDTWNEQLLPPSSGTSVHPIIISSYGTGVKPLITGLQTLSGFVNTSGNIWSATATNSVKSQNTVLIGGAIRAKGRYPNTTYLLTTAPSSGTTVNTGLTGTPSYMGAEIAYGPQSWICDVSRITNQSTGVLTIYPAASYSSNGNNGYCLQNLPSLCDVQNEWAYDSTTKLLSIYSTSTPSVQISSIDTLVYLNHKDYITFSGLNFTGANKIALSYDTCTHVTIQNCTFNNNGKNAIQTSGSTYGVISNDSILNSLNDAIYTYYRSDNTKIDGNYIKNTGMFFGMGASSDLAGMGMHAYGNSDTVTNNIIDSIGYNGVYFSGTNSIVKYNYITNFCYNKSDGGAIYAYGGATNGSIVRLNICKNGLGGIAGNINNSPGIFMDQNGSGETIDSNTVIDCYGIGYQVNDAAVNINFKYNTIFQTSYNCTMISSRGGSTLKNNIYYSKDSTRFSFYAPALGATDFLDSNYYLRPVKEDKKFAYVNTNSGSQYSLAEWQTLWTSYGWDAHSNSTPLGITAAAGVIYYNATSSVSTVSVGGSYIDAKGNHIYGYFNLQPFESKILFTSSSSFAPNSGGGRIGNIRFSN